MNEPVDDSAKDAIERIALTLLLLVIVMAALLLLKGGLYSEVPDNRQVLYGYADQLVHGNGLVFNPDQRTLLIGAPAYMVVLGVFSLPLLPLDGLFWMNGTPIYTNIAGAADLVFVVALAVSTFSLFRLTRRNGFSLIGAGIVALIFAFAWPLWIGVGTAFPLMTALCLLALDLALDMPQNRWQAAGVVMALAVLCNPEAMLLAIPLLFYAATRGAGQRFGLALFVPLLAALAALWWYYGASLWDGLLILRSSQSKLTDLLPWLLSVPLIVLAVWGWLRRNGEPLVAILGGWAALHLLIIGGLLRVPTGWQYAPLAAVIMLLIVLGAQRLSIGPRAGLTAALAALIIAPTLIGSGIPTTSTPLTVPTDIESVGVMSTSQALQFQRSPAQPLISFDGQLQPDIKNMLERGDAQSALIAYAPRLLYTSNGARIPLKALAAGTLAALNYQPTADSGVFLRHSDIGAFVAKPISLAYGIDIRLVGMAVDRASLLPGQVLRVRLDWQIERSATAPVTVDVALDSGEYILGRALDEYSPSVFEAGQWSTYHALAVSKEAWTGPLALNVGLIINGGVVARADTVTLNVETP